MQESMVGGGGIVFYQILEATPFPGNGDKIKLPPSCFTELSNQGAFDKGPLHFKLSVVHQDENPSDTDNGERESHRTTHSGVLEFTADEGLVAIPPHVWSNLFPTSIPKVPLVEVRYVLLPKGTYAKLQPDGMGFSDLPNQKAVLETRLRQHATLSQGVVVTVNYGELAYQLRVLELKPSSSVSVLETDIEVDIVYPDGSSEAENQNTLKALVLCKPESGLVEEGKYVYYKFSIDGATWEIIHSGEKRVEIRIDIENAGGDMNVYVSKHPLLFPTRHQHQWSSHDVNSSKILILSSEDNNFGIGTYSIGVYGFKDMTKYKVLVNIEDNTGRKLGQQATSSSSSMEVEDTVKCRNCNHFIPRQSIMLHEAYCSRHSVACKYDGCGVVLRAEEAKNHVHCEKCGQGFHCEELEKHLKVFHEPRSCACGVVLEKTAMVRNPPFLVVYKFFSIQMLF